MRFHRLPLTQPEERRLQKRLIKHQDWIFPFSLPQTLRKQHLPILATLTAIFTDSDCAISFH